MGFCEERAHGGSSLVEDPEQMFIDRDRTFNK